MLFSNKEKRELFQGRGDNEEEKDARKEREAREVLAQYSDLQLERMSYDKIGALVGRSGATIRHRVVRNNMNRRDAAIYVHIPREYALNGGRRLRTGLVKLAEKHDVNVSTLASAKSRNPNKDTLTLIREIKERRRLKESQQ